MNDYPGTNSALSELSSFLESNDWKNQLLEIRHLFYEQIQSSNVITEDLHQAIQQTLLQNSKHLKNVLEELCASMQNQLNHSQYALDVLAQFLEYYKSHPVEKPDFNTPNSQRESSNKDDAVHPVDLQMFAETTDDYVIVDEEPIRELQIPDEFVVRVGNNRVKINIHLLLTIISIVIGIVSCSSGSSAENQEEQIRILNEMNDSINSESSECNSQEQTTPSSTELMQL